MSPLVRPIVAVAALLVVGAGEVVDGVVEVASEVEVLDVVVGTWGNESVGDTVAMLQNCCARFSEEDNWSAQFARMHATSSGVNWGLRSRNESLANTRHVFFVNVTYFTQKQLTSTTLEHPTLDIAEARQSETMSRIK